MAAAATPARLRRAARVAASSAPGSAASTRSCSSPGSALIAFSIYTLGVATSEDVPGNPYYYVVRQSIYAVVGIALMFAVARIDYSRFRELRVGIYTAMIGADRPRARCSARRPAARGAGSSCRSSPSSPPSSARCCCRHPGGVRDRPRRGGSRSASGRCGSWRWGCSRRRSSSSSRTSARRSSTAVITLAVLFIAGRPLDALRGARRRGRGGGRNRAGDRSRRSVPLSSQHYQQDRLTAFLHPKRRPRRLQLSDQSSR